MIFDHHETVPVLIRRADDGITVLRIITRAWNSKAAIDAQDYAREATDPYVEAEIAKWAETASPEWLPIKGWRRCSEAELPERNSATRDAWRDDGDRIAVDPTCIKTPPPDPRDAEIADLKAKVEALTARVDKVDPDGKAARFDTRV